MTLVAFSSILARSIEDDLLAAAVVDRDGKTIGIAGAITDEEAMPLVALVMYRLKTPDLSERLFAGEILALRLDDCDVAVAVAKRQLFLVVKLENATQGALAGVRDLLESVERMVTSARDQMDKPPPWSRGGGGSGSGPAELPLIELGVTVRRPRAKA